MKIILLPEISEGSGDRVYLNFAEYFTQDSYGNLVFKSERLTGLAGE